MNFQIWKSLLLASVVTPIFLLGSFLACGVGHGNCALPFILFPYSVVLAKITRGAALLPLVAAVIQFPAYGLIVGLVAQMGVRWIWTAACLLALHVVVIGLAFWFG